MMPTLTVRYLYLANELLKKEKKAKIYEYIKAYYPDCHYSTKDKKERLMNYIKRQYSKFTPEQFQEVINFFGWNITTNDIFGEYNYKSVINAVITVDEQLNYLRYKKNFTDDIEKKIKYRNAMQEIYYYRDNSMKNLVLTKQCRIHAIFDFQTEKQKYVIFLTHIWKRKFYFKVNTTDISYNTWYKLPTIKHSEYVVPEYPIVKKGINKETFNRAMEILREFSCIKPKIVNEQAYLECKAKREAKNKIKNPPK